jgi:outer membrane receptor protein involved in Fe transport
MRHTRRATRPISPAIVNAGDATLYGFEVEAEAIVGGGFSVNASAGYTHAKYDRLNDVIDNGYARASGMQHSLSA